MRAHIPINAKTNKEIKALAYDAVMKERADIATRSLYLVLLAMYQVGLSPRTMKRVQDALPVVTKKYHEYRNAQLADEWARVTLQDVGVDVPETGERL